MDPKKAANSIVSSLVQIAIDNGAKPAPILLELHKLQYQMQSAYRTGDLEGAIELAEQIGKKAKKGIAQIDAEWTERMQEEDVIKYLQDSEYLEAVANRYSLYKWSEAYSPKGGIIRILREYAESVEKHERLFIGPSLN